jgi:hypothetical protein
MNLDREYSKKREESFERGCERKTGKKNCETKIARERL